MGCLSENAVLEFLQGGLSAEAALAVEDHVDGCDDCRRLLAETARSLGAPAGLDRGAAIGRYLVLAPVGAGGMGVVYAAYDPELDRKVAIKLLRPDVQGASGQQLLREAQAMARLSHPNVVAVHDAGTYEGRVFVAMEYVEGETLSAWRKREPRSWREILNVYIAAGRGLAAAHAAGLVHRDFKPDNVIIDKERVRVTDFGLARPVGANAPAPGSDASSDRTTAIAGTPAYMAPEQRVGLPVDARSDQYSFCVSLYEALHGFRPNDDVETRPEKPRSSRARVQPQRISVPPWIRRALARGLAEQPAARFPSMDGLVAELARDPGVILRRRITAAAALGLVVAGIVGWRTQQKSPCRGAEARLRGVWDDGRKQLVHGAFAATGQPYAEDAFASTARTLDDYARSWVGQRTDACEATRVRGEQSDELLDLRMRCLDARREELSALADLYSRADADLVRRSVAAAHALTPLGDCADRAALTNRARPPAASREDIAKLRDQLAHAKATEAAGHYRDALAAIDPLADAAKKIAWRPLEAEVLYEQARIVDRTGDAKAAEQLFHEALRAAEAGRADATAVGVLVDLMYVVGYEQSRHADGDLLALDARAALERIGNPERQTALFESQLGTLTGEEWKTDESLAHYQRALALQEKLAGADSLEVSLVLTNLGITQYQRGDYEKAIATHRRAIAIRERMLGRSHPETAMSLTDYGNACAAAGRIDDALAAQERAVGIWKAALGPDHPNVATGLLNLGAVLAMQGRANEALDHFRRALAIREQKLGTEHLDTATALNNVGEVLEDMNRHDEAAGYFRRALAIVEKAAGTAHPDYAETLANLGIAELGSGHRAEALADVERAIAISEKALGPGHPQLAPLLTDLGRVRLANGKDAVAPLERSLALREKTHASDYDTADTQFWLARALWTAGQKDRSRQQAGAAREVFAHAGTRGKKSLAEADSWLLSH
jgi:tetratricopeptide (TPR) repeat protein